MPERGIDRRDDHVDVGDAAVGDEDLRAVEDPLVAVAPRGGAQRADVRPRPSPPVTAYGAEADLVAGPEARLAPSGPTCSGVPVAAIPRGRERRARDRERDARAAPVQLLA
jgi:hypothetical protein